MGPVEDSVAGNETGEWLRQRHELKTVDFTAPMTDKSCTVDNITDGVLAGNTVARHLEGGLVDRAIRRPVEKGGGHYSSKPCRKDLFGEQGINASGEPFGKHDNSEKLLNKAEENVLLFLSSTRCQEVSMIS